MQNERVDNRPSSVSSAEKSEGNGLGKLIESYFQRISVGEPAEVVIKEIWAGHFRGITPRDQAVSIVSGLFEKLPEETREQLEGSWVERKTQMMWAVEEARKQVEDERRAMAEVPNKPVKNQPEKRKKPSRGMAKHIRRVKAEERRGGIRS